MLPDSLVGLKWVSAKLYSLPYLTSNIGLVSDLAEGQTSLVPPIFPGDNAVEKWTNFVLGTQMIKRGGLGAPYDIAGIVSFLASDAGNWVHGKSNKLCDQVTTLIHSIGQTWAVDGGMYMP